MLAELPERDATGEIAGVYAEIRRLWAVPYVSSLQRHLATRPGWLEWSWAALAPAFTGGRAQAAARRAADGLVVPRLASISRDALVTWGLDAAAEDAVRAACASFVRVAPINLVFSGLLRRLLGGERPGGAPAPDTAWTPPPPLGALPPLVDAATLPPAARALLASLGTALGDEPFVPGLYRMLAAWPGLLAHVATVLHPLMEDGATLASCRRLLAAVDAEVGPMFALLPPPPEAPPRPAADNVPAVLAALDTYRKTSPEMVVFGRMLGDALPRP
ncbi:MAG TPA: hypothetical protein VF197_06405 [Methylomirabilota bacterium]